MNTNITKIIRISGSTITLAILMALAGEVRADGAKGGASKLGAAAPAPVVAAATGAKAMSCGKCKEEYSRRIDSSARGANKPAIFVARHLCEGCSTEWKVVGHGKEKASVASHVCRSCGAASAACCSPRDSDVATKGMGKKFEVAPLK